MVLSSALKVKIDALEKQGKTINVVMRDGKALGAIALADVIRESRARRLMLFVRWGEDCHDYGRFGRRGKMGRGRAWY